MITCLILFNLLMVGGTYLHGRVELGFSRLAGWAYGVGVTLLAWVVVIGIGWLSVHAP